MNQVSRIETLIFDSQYLIPAQITEPEQPLFSFGYLPRVSIKHQNKQNQNQKRLSFPTFQNVSALYIINSNSILDLCELE